MQYTIGIDFDGTVVTHEYPYVGKDIGAVPVLKRLIECGNRLILFTMRSSKNGTLQDAVNWFKKNGIELYGVNSNPTQAEWTDSPKAHCDLYIDDAGFGTPTIVKGGRRFVDWETVEALLEFEYQAFEDEYDDYDEEPPVENNEDNSKNIMENYMNLTESEIKGVVMDTVKMVLKESGRMDDLNEETERSEEYYESPDGSEKSYTKTEVTVSDGNESESDGESDESRNTSKSSDGEPEYNGYVGLDAEEIGVDVDETNGSQIGQGGDPFSEKTGRPEVKIDQTEQEIEREINEALRRIRNKK